MMIWSKLYPEDCPPKDAQATSGEYYRLIEGKEVKEEDFKSYRELYPERDFSVPECQAVGLSVYTEISDVERLIRRIPALMKKKNKNKLSLAQANLSPTWGKVKNTPSNENSHHTWWIPEGKKAWKIFKIIDFPE